MDPALLNFIARSFGGAITAAARPALTFFAVQLFAAGLIHYGQASLPVSFLWLVSTPALAAGGVLAALELLAQHDEVAGVLRDLHIERLLGVFGTFSVGLLFAALGLPEGDAQALVGADLAPVVRGPDSSAQLAVIGASVALNLGITWARGVILDWLSDLSLDLAWARLESGGILMALLLLLFFPLIALGMLVLSAITLGALSLTIQMGQAALDRMERVRCPTCSHAVRPEASLCPKCRGALTPTALGGPSVGRLRAGWGRLRGA